MKLAELRERIERRARPGWRVSFERPVPGGWLSDMVPGRDEPALSDEASAWELADQVATVLPNVVNIHVIRADDFTPVNGGRERMIRPGYGRAQEAMGGCGRRSGDA